jgi:DNA-binding response OmpR family regulator
MAELEARLKALSKRGRSGEEAVLRVGDLVFDTRTYEVRNGRLPVVLTRTGYRILALLMRQSPRVVERESIEEEIWGDDRPGSDALRTHIHALRQALHKAGAAPMLKTVQGIGYRLVHGGE